MKITSLKKNNIDFGENQLFDYNIDFNDKQINLTDTKNRIFLSEHFEFQ